MGYLHFQHAIMKLILDFMHSTFILVVLVALLMGSEEVNMQRPIF